MPKFRDKVDAVMRDDPSMSEESARKIVGSRMKKERKDGAGARRKAKNALRARVIIR